MKNLISVIVPIYKVEKYIEQCVNSIIKQTYGNLEIILVDDGSPDTCPQICENFAKKDTRIKVIHKINGGLSDARNAGIKIASGDYITFVDSDDYLKLDMIENLYQLCMKYEADISQCTYIRCSEDGVEDRNITSKNEEFVYYDNKMENFLFGKQIGVTAWGKLYKTTLFQDIRYPKGKYHEDVFTTYKLIDKAKCVVTTTKIGYVYRKNGTSITNEKFSLNRLHSIEGKLEQAKFISENYPQLLNLANAGIIYACNQCLSQMGKSGFNDKKIDDYIKILYRNYWKDYVCSNATLKGKLFAIVARINYKFAKKISILL